MRNYLLYYLLHKGPNEGLEAIRKALNKQKYQTISMDRLILLAECILNNNIFEHKRKHFKQLQVIVRENKFAPPYVFLLWGYLEENTFSFIC